MDEISQQKADSIGEMEAVSRAIQRYLTEFPHAMDTEEGIFEWWLMRENIRTKLDTLKHALEYLVESGFLEVEGTSENPRYRLHADTQLQDVGSGDKRT